MENEHGFLVDESNSAGRVETREELHTRSGSRIEGRLGVGHLATMSLAQWAPIACRADSLRRRRLGSTVKSGRSLRLWLPLVESRALGASSVGVIHVGSNVWFGGLRADCDLAEDSFAFFFSKKKLGGLEVR